MAFPIGHRSICLLDDFLSKSVPLRARWALAQPFGALLSAITAKESGFDFTHALKIVAR